MKKEKRLDRSFRFYTRLHLMPLTGLKAVNIMEFLRLIKRHIRENPRIKLRFASPDKAFHFI